MKKFLHMQKGVFALLLALGLGMGTAYAYDFSETYSGKTFYFNIINSTQHYVEITYPGTSSNPWEGFTKPTGTITLPSIITHNGVTYMVTQIGAYAFYTCTGLTGTLTIPNTVGFIDSFAFTGCGFTGSLSIPNSVTIIGDNAFASCYGFTSLSLGNGVEIIGTGAFYMCSGFRGNLIIPSTQQIQIYGQAFDGCGFTGTLSIGTNTYSMGNKSFGNCPGFTEVRYNAVNCHDVTETMKPFEGCGGALIIGSGVQRMPAHIFKGNAFTSVTYNATNCADVTSTAKPFEDCTCTLTIGYSVQRIPAYMFYECNGFTGSLTIPNSVTTIGQRAFDGCDGFDGNLTLGSSVTSIGAFAFNECYNFTGSLTIPNSVVSIGESAFNWCTGFNGGLHIGNGVTTIGEGAFSDCSGFWSTLNVGNNVVTIGSYAFSGCTGFANLDLPRSLTTIGSYAFYGCNGFNQVDIDNISHNLTSIGNRAFHGCTGLTKVNYWGSFSDWCGISFGDAYSNPLFYAHNLYLDVGTTSTNLQLVNDLVIPEGVTVIKEYAFERATCLTSLTIGSSVTSIEAVAFEYCTSLATMTVRPETPPSLGQSAFNNVPTTIPVYVPCQSYSTYHTTSGWSTFTNMHTSSCDPLTYSINSDGVSVTVTGHVEGYAATGDLYIPAVKTINGVTYNVTAIGTSAFRDHSGLTGTLTIPNSVTSIGGWAFRGCSGFTGTPVISNSVTSIGDNAFQDCSGFTGSLTIPSSVTSIGNYAFQDCTGFDGDLYIFPGVTSIGNYAFSGCSGFTGSLGVPNSVTTIGQYAFSGCSGFNGGLNIGSGVTTIGQGAFKNCSGCWTINYNAVNCSNLTSSTKPFEGCTNATSLSIGSGVQRIPAYMFYLCSNFTSSLTIPNSVTIIGNSAFRGCTGLTGSLVIPDSVTSIGDYAFYSCHSFTGTLTLSNSLTTIGNYVFEHCYGFHGILTIPNSVTWISDGAFAYCAGFMGSLTIPNSVTFIGSNAFEYCDGLTGMLTIGSSVTDIAGAAFSDCSHLSSIIVYPETPPTLSPNVFQNVPTNIPVYVPCSSLVVYQEDSDWNRFTNIQCVPETLTVYNGMTTNSYVPVYGYYTDAYLKAEFVMPAAELAEMADGTITSMKFYARQASVDWGAANFQVFLTEVTNTTISDFAGPGTVVYEGALSIVDGEMTVNFTTPYPYLGGNLLVGIYNTVKGTYVSSTWYGKSVTGASVQGYSYSSLSDISPAQRDFIPKTTFTYTPTACSIPKDLTETDITFNSATLDWTGYQDSYDLRYRKKPIFFEDFENGLPSSWTAIDNDGDGYNWHSESNYGASYCHSGSTIMVSASYVYENNTNIALTPDNWLVTPLLDLQGTMKVWIRAQHPNFAQEHFAIYLSTTGNSVDDFTTVLVPETTLTNSVYGAYTADLSAYAGQQGYIAIRHFNCTDMYELLVDDFGLFENPDMTVEWETINNINPDYTLNALELGTEYEWQVRGRDCDGEGSYTEWSRAHSFVTLPLCSPEDKCELTFTLTDSYGDTWNGNAINVVDEETGVVLATMTNDYNNYAATGASGSYTQTKTLSVCDGRGLSFEWVSGSWSDECSYTITSANGTVVLEGMGSNNMNTGYVLGTYMVNCSAVFQTIELSAGWNWVSLYIEVEDPIEMLEVVEAALGTNGQVIKNSQMGTEYDEEWGWFGDLDDVGMTNEQMYKIQVSAPCTLNMEWTAVDPAGHPITINPGWNWIGFPSTVPMSLEDAFAGFAQEGDKIRNSAAEIVYDPEWGWFGDFETLVPGQGYMYYSASNTPRVLSFAQHEYVDLGLPSGLLWATCNVGAASPEDYGDYFAWGETQPKDYYDWSTYQHCMGSFSTLTKYCYGSNYGYNGFIDYLSTLEPSDDAATANWGGNWRMPTQAEWQELIDNTTVTWTQQGGVNGALLTASNGNSLFLPAAGCRYGSNLSYGGYFSEYWSSSLETDGSYFAWYYVFSSSDCSQLYTHRSDGRSVRAVRSAE
ncbi:MAG: leucine-rich repeat protein [Muribaculaceae bacterium]|nr:leucine-rich repeat protein [Muribaculaceae bacterium]